MHFDINSGISGKFSTYCPYGVDTFSIYNRIKVVNIETVLSFSPVCESFFSDSKDETIFMEKEIKGKKV